MQQDILGGGYFAETIPLKPDTQGDVVATLVHLRGEAPPEGGPCVLYVHGYNDYFFQAELGHFYDRLGVAFYALDLRKYGRSIRPWQKQTLVGDLSTYFEELDQAIDRLRGRDKRTQVLLSGHSSGGLGSTMYAAARRESGWLDALHLNAPFLSSGLNVLEREATLAQLHGLPEDLIIKGSGSESFAWSLHRSFRRGGEWDYDLSWKVAGGVPLYAGNWRAVLGAQKDIDQGHVTVDVPTLVQISARSGADEPFGAQVFETDTALDVDAVMAVARTLGPKVVIQPIDGAMHDIMCSRRPVREAAYQGVSSWLTELGWLGS